jgi:hypothetical protein
LLDLIQTLKFANLGIVGPGYLIVHLLA